MPAELMNAFIEMHQAVINIEMFFRLAPDTCDLGSQIDVIVCTDEHATCALWILNHLTE